MSELRTAERDDRSACQVGELALAAAPALPAHLTVAAGRKVAELKKTALVVIERDGRLVGIVDEAALLRAPDEARLGDVMKCLDVCLTPATPLARARDMFARTGAAALPVVAGSFLLGAVTRAAVERGAGDRQRLELAVRRPAAGRRDVPAVDTSARRSAA